MRLHLVSQSPFSGPAFSDCLRHAGEGDTVLLIQDGVYAALAKTAGEAKAKSVRIVALDVDIYARGIAAHINPAISLVNDREFVALTVDHESTQSWF